jgi:hypothetical protein
MANGPDKCQKKNRRLKMTQNHTLNMPEGSGERASGGKGVVRNTLCSGKFFSERQPSGRIARKSHNGTILSAEKKVALKNSIDMNIDLFGVSGICVRFDVGTSCDRYMTRFCHQRAQTQRSDTQKADCRTRRKAYGGAETRWRQTYFS